MITSKQWAENSLFLDLHDSIGIKEFTYVCLITAVLMLIHSSYLHKYKISTIRFYTDASCFSTVFASVLLLIALHNRNPRTDAFFVNLCVYGIFGTTVQLCDNYMTFSRYLVVYPKTTITFKVTVHLYIWFLLVFTYLPFETVLPCFVNTNSPSISRMNTIFAGYIFMTSYLLYNAYFSFKFWRALNNKSMFGGCSKKMVILGYKNLLHIFISSIGMVLQGLESTFSFEPLGCLASYFTVNVALHILFNCRIEKTIPFSATKRHRYIKKWRFRLRKLWKRCCRLFTSKSEDDSQDSSSSSGWKWQQQQQDHGTNTSFQYLCLVVRRLLSTTKSNASSAKVTPVKRKDQPFIIRELICQPQPYFQRQLKQSQPHPLNGSVNFVQSLSFANQIDQRLLENEEDFEDTHKGEKEMVQRKIEPPLNYSTGKEDEDEEEIGLRDLEAASRGKEDEVRNGSLPQANNTTTTASIAAETLRYQLQQQQLQQQQQQQLLQQQQQCDSDIPLGEISSYSAFESQRQSQSQYRNSSLELFNSVVPARVSSVAGSTSR